MHSSLAPSTVTIGLLISILQGSALGNNQTIDCQVIYDAHSIEPFDNQLRFSWNINELEGTERCEGEANQCAIDIAGTMKASVSDPSSFRFVNYLDHYCQSEAAMGWEDFAIEFDYKQSTALPESFDLSICLSTFDDHCESINADSTLTTACVLLSSYTSERTRGTWRNRIRIPVRDFHSDAHGTYEADKKHPVHIAALSFQQPSQECTIYFDNLKLIRRREVCEAKIVAEGSVASRLAGMVLLYGPRGPQGPEGPPGERGEDGPSPRCYTGNNGEAEERPRSQMYIGEFQWERDSDDHRFPCNERCDAWITDSQEVEPNMAPATQDTLISIVYENPNYFCTVATVLPPNFEVNCYCLYSHENQAYICPQRGDTFKYYMVNTY